MAIVDFHIQRTTLLFKTKLNDWIDNKFSPKRGKKKRKEKNNYINQAPLSVMSLTSSFWSLDFTLKQGLYRVRARVKHI